MNDPAFLFYPGDYLRDTQNLSPNTQVAYDRIMCEHMRNICISQQQLKFFTKRLSDDEKEELSMILIEIPEGFQIKWVAESISKRLIYSESRRKNRLKNKENISKTYVQHMENENEIENINEIKIEKGIVKGKNKNFNFQKTLLEFGADQKLVSDWLEVRKKKKASNTETACKSFLDQVIKSGKTIDEILFICVDRSWKGFQAEWIQDESKPDKFVKDMEEWNKAAREILNEKKLNDGFKSLERG